MKFREQHNSELSVYDAALKELREHYGDQKFMTMKQLYAKKSELVSAKNEQYENFCFARSKRKEIPHFSDTSLIDKYSIVYTCSFP